MNGKVARALRHLKAETLNIRDVGIISRRLKAQEAGVFHGPKPLVTRQRKASPGFVPPMGGISQRRPIVLRPVRAIRLRLKADNIASTASIWRHLTGGHAWDMRSAGNRVPKHVLDRLAA